jgi:nucleotide-binding universal stress UspA family protein
LKGNFGTVVIGRRGINKAFFMGSVSRYIINRISNRSLWIVT